MAGLRADAAAPAWMAGRGGRPAGHCMRDIVDAIRYLINEGIQWRALPCDFPPFRTVYDCWTVGEKRRDREDA